MLGIINVGEKFEDSTREREEFTMNNISSLDAYLSYHATKKQLESNAFGRGGSSASTGKDVESQKVPIVNELTTEKKNVREIMCSQDRHGNELSLARKRNAEIREALFSNKPSPTEQIKGQIFDAIQSQERQVSGEHKDNHSKLNALNVSSFSTGQQQDHLILWNKLFKQQNRPLLPDVQNQSLQNVENIHETFRPLTEKDWQKQPNTTCQSVKEASSLLLEQLIQQKHCQTQKASSIKTEDEKIEDLTSRDQERTGLEQHIQLQRKVIKAKEERIESMSREQKQLTVKVESYEKRTHAEVLRLTSQVQSRDHDLGKLQRLLATGKTPF